MSRTLTLLANGHFYAGHYAIADSLNRVVLALDLAIHGPDHPRIAGDEIDLGAVRQELGDWPRALKHYRRPRHLSALAWRRALRDRNLVSLEGGSFDAVYCSHNLDHYYRKDVFIGSEIYRKYAAKFLDAMQVDCRG